MLAELHRRELDVAALQATIEITLGGLSGNADMDKLSPLVTDLSERIRHTAYTSAHAAAARRKRLEDARRLQAVSELNS